MRDYITKRWLPLLIANRLTTFKQWWNLVLAAYEPSNNAKRGWSTVFKHQLQDPSGTTKTVFIKRQWDYNGRSWHSPIRGEPTLRREARNILHYQSLLNPADLIFYAERKIKGKRCAILVLAAIEDHEPLSQLLLQWHQQNTPRQIRLPYLYAVADCLAKLHHKKLQYGCLYPRHIFCKHLGGKIALKLLDVERLKWLPFKSLCQKRDLDTLNRHTKLLSKTDKLRFLYRYLNVQNKTPELCGLWHYLAMHFQSHIQKKAKQLQLD